MKIYKIPYVVDCAFQNMKKILQKQTELTGHIIIISFVNTHAKNIEDQLNINRYNCILVALNPFRVLTRGSRSRSRLRHTPLTRYAPADHMILYSTINNHPIMFTIPR